MENHEEQTTPLIKGNSTTKQEKLVSIGAAAKKLQGKVSKHETSVQTAVLMAQESEDCYQADEILHKHYAEMDAKPRTATLVFTNGDKLHFTVADGKIAAKIQDEREASENHQSQFNLGNFTGFIKDAKYNDLFIELHWSYSVHSSKIITLFI